MHSKLALFPGSTEAKNLPASAEDTRNVGSIPASEDPLEKEMAAHSSILAKNLPWTEDPGRLHPWRRKSQT